MGTAQAAQLNEFLDELPEVPRDKVCVDDSDGYQAHLGHEGKPPNEFGFDSLLVD